LVICRTSSIFASFTAPQKLNDLPYQENSVTEPPSSTIDTYNSPAQESASFYGPEIVVAGALAVDFACDYAPLVDALSDAAISPQLRTSNPSTIIQTLGGVAHNVARSAHLLGGNVRLCSAVGNDLSGQAAISNLKSQGIRTDGIEILDDNNAYRTAQYIAVNDAHKNLMLAMADMNILESISNKDLNAIWLSGLKSAPPRCLVVDANWSPSALRSWLHAGRSASAITVFEPVSTAKSTRLFTTSPNELAIPVYPNHLVDIASPNIHEVAALHNAAHRQGLFDRQDWWHLIDSLGIPSSGLRTALAMTTSSSLVDQGLPQQSIQLLPFIPTLLTKLGPKGVLLTMLLPADDLRLQNANDAPYVLARSKNSNKHVGGLYVRLFEPEEILGSGEVVSVNGVGDTFLGAAVAGIANGKRIEDVISIAQEAARLSLKSKESVSLELARLRGFWQS
jgi:pseudouridylate synthase / pseudouridine kinase